MVVATLAKALSKALEIDGCVPFGVPPGHDFCFLFASTHRSVRWRITLLVSYATGPVSDSRLLEPVRKAFQVLCIHAERVLQVLDITHTNACMEGALLPVPVSHNQGLWLSQHRGFHHLDLHDKQPRRFRAELHVKHRRVQTNQGEISYG